MPVPGMPIVVVRRPDELMLYRAPFVPKDIPTLLALKFIRTPGPSLMLFRARK